MRELLRQRNGILIDTNAIHIASAAGHHQQVIISGLHVAQQRIRRQRLAFVTVVLHGLTRVQRGGGKRHLSSGSFEVTQRARQLSFLNAPVVDDNQNLAVLHSHSGLLHAIGIVPLAILSRFGLLCACFADRI